VVDQYASRARPLVRLSDGLDTLTEAGYVLLTASFAVVMALGVFYRYVLNDSLAWSDELGLVLFAWATFLSVATCYLHDKHFNIDLVVRSLSAAWQARVATLADGLAGGYILALLVSSLQGLPVVARARTDALQWPMTLPYAAIPVACVLMLVHWARRTVTISTWTSGIVRLAVMLGFFVAVYLPLGHYVAVTGAGRVALLALVLAIPLVVGVPVAFSLGLMATTYVAVFGTIPFHTGALQVFYGIEVLAFLAVPLLILSGMLMHISGIAQRLVDFAQALVGRVRGGLAASDVVASLIFADISGSAASDTAAIGAIMIPAMKKRGYHGAFCAALQGASGTLGLMFPPAITLLLYAVAMNVSVSRLFAASLVPGLLVAGSFVVVAYAHARRNGYPRERVPVRELVPRTLGALPGLFAAVIVVGGIVGGVFTPAEAGVVLLAYVLLLAVVVYRKAGPRGVYRATIGAGYISGMMLLLVATSAFLAFVLAYDDVAFALADAVAAVTQDRTLVLVLLNVVFIVLGMFLEAAPIIFGFLPSFMPLVAKIGVDPVLWGVIFVINMGIGMLTPPVALTLYISTAIAEVPFAHAVRASLPFMAIMVIDLMLVAFFPGIAMWLPGVLFGATPH
jgi:tripartite ATP-independent transporter DctM subunit